MQRRTQCSLARLWLACVSKELVLSIVALASCINFHATACGPTTFRVLVLSQRAGLLIGVSPRVVAMLNVAQPRSALERATYRASIPTMTDSWIPPQVETSR